MKELKIIFIILLISKIGSTQNRVVLLEQFSNSGCPPCATYTPPILDYVKNNPQKVIAITYHTAYPYLDSMYYENPIESDARVSYYGSFGVPHSIVDGNYLVSSSGNIVNTFATSVNNRSIVESKYNITTKNVSLQNGIISGKINFSSLTNLNQNDSLKAFIIAIENRVEKSAYAASPGKNSETFYSNVMRKFLTPINGISLTNKTMGTSDSISFSWNIKNLKVEKELRIIAFIQNSTTKEIYQSSLINPFNIVSSVATNTNENSLVTIYPNPSTAEVNIIYTYDLPYQLTVFNTLGQTVYSEVANKEKHSIALLEKGLFTISIQSKENKIYRKVIIG